jgi:hypothetical protein
LLRIGGGIIDEETLPVPAADVALFRHPLGENRLYAVSRAGSEELCVLSTLELDGEAWRLVGEAQLPRFFPEELHFLPGIRDNDLLLMASPEALMLYETGTSRGQILEMKNHAWSNALNGVVYLAVSSEEGIALRRIGE